MGKLEMGLWAADFIITGIGWALGGAAAAVFCFLVAGVLTFLVVSREEKGDPMNSPSRLKKWHRYGMATFIALIVILGGAMLVRRVTMAAAIPQNSLQSQPQASPQPTPTPPPTPPAKETTPKKGKPSKKAQTQNNLGGTGNTQQQQNNSGGTNTQQQSTGDQSPNLNCPNGICAGRDINGNPTINNFGPPQRSLADQQGRAFYESLAASPPQHKLIIWARGGEESIRFTKRMNAFLPPSWPAQLMADNQLIDSDNGMEIWAHPDSAAAKVDAVLLQNAFSKAGMNVPIVANTHQDNWKDSAWLVIFAIKR